MEINFTKSFINGTGLNGSSQSSITTAVNYSTIYLADIISSSGRGINFTMKNFYFRTFLSSPESYLLGSEELVNNIPTVSNQTNISPQTFNIETDLRGHSIYSDIDNDNSTGNQTLWYVNNSLINEANNSITLGKGNITKGSRIRFSIRYNDTFEWGNWTNSSEFFPIEINSSFSTRKFKPSAKKIIKNK